MIIDAIYNRRSIRKYENKELPKEIVEQIIDAARVAPSGKNRQPWKFIVYTKDQKKKLLEAMENGIDRESASPVFPDSHEGIPDARNTLRIMKEAAVIVTVLYTNAKGYPSTLTPDEWFRLSVDTQSVGAAVENMILKAEDMGIGSLWIGNTGYAYQELTNFMQTQYQFVGAVALGYAAEQPMPRPRKKMEEIVEYYGY